MGGLQRTEGRHQPCVIQDGECCSTSDRKQWVTFKLETRGCCCVSAVFSHQIWACVAETHPSTKVSMKCQSVSFRLICAVRGAVKSKLRPKRLNRDRMTFAAPKRFQVYKTVHGQCVAKCAKSAAINVLVSRIDANRQRNIRNMVTMRI